MPLPSIHLLPPSHGLVVTPTSHGCVAPCSKAWRKSLPLPASQGLESCLLTSLTQSLRPPAWAVKVEVP